MKKLYISFALVLWSCVQIAVAQNMYRNYQSTWVSKPTSAVSVVHSNGYVYFFQADGSGKLSATEIDPLTMLPTGNDQLYDMTQQNFNFSVNGGFEDASGNFVLFGDINNSNPALVVIKSDFLTCTFYYWGCSWKFTAGCYGYDTGGNEVYLLVNDGGLIAANAANPASLASKIDLPFGPVAQDSYTDISWDVAGNHFVATGSARNTPAGHEDPFVEIFDLLSPNPSYSVSSLTGYYVCDPAFVQSNEYTTLHVQIDNDNLVLYHDLRIVGSLTSYDMIWMTRIRDFRNAFTATVVESWVYQLPNTKLFARDMLYDPFNNRLNFLGYYNHCMEGLTQILAQVNPYSLSSGIHIGQLGATYPGGSCPNYQQPYNVLTLYNDLEMSNLAWNYHNPCFPVLAAGVRSGLQSLLAETYDISLSTCDKPLWHTDYPANPKPILYSLNPIYPSCSIQSNFVSASPDIVSVIIECDDGSNACSHQFEDKALPYSITNASPSISLSAEGSHRFVCEGFEGDIEYSLYDMTGKLLQRGTTRNGEQNVLKKSNGVYMLRATDCAGNRMTTKLILF